MFDKYISLGDNCEIGLNFSRVGYEYSSLLRFAMTPTKSLLSLLDGCFDGLFETISPISNNMCQCQKYKISFHTKIHSEINGDVRKYKDGIDVDTIHQNDLNKIKYLTEKLISDMSSPDKILYLLKSNVTTKHDDILSIFNKIKSYGGNPTLLVLSLQETSENINNNIVYECFPRFAPYNDAYDYDVEAWDNIFIKYPLKEHKYISCSGLVPVEL